MVIMTLTTNLDISKNKSVEFSGDVFLQHKQNHLLWCHRNETRKKYIRENDW